MHCSPGAAFNSASQEPQTSSGLNKHLQGIYTLEPLCTDTISISSKHAVPESMQYTGLGSCAITNL